MGPEGPAAVPLHYVGYDSLSVVGALLGALVVLWGCWYLMRRTVAYQGAESEKASDGRSGGVANDAVRLGGDDGNISAATGAETGNRAQGDGMSDASVRARQAAELEYADLTSNFVVVETGVDTVREDDSDSLSSFVAAIMSRGIVDVHQLAREFGLTAVACRDRITRMVAQEDGVLQGTFDEYGRFIVLTNDMLRDLIDHVDAKGLVRVGDLGELLRDAWNAEYERQALHAVSDDDESIAEEEDDDEDDVGDL